MCVCVCTDMIGAYLRLEYLRILGETLVQPLISMAIDYSLPLGGAIELVPASKLCMELHLHLTETVKKQNTRGNETATLKNVFNTTLSSVPKARYRSKKNTGEIRKDKQKK